MIDRIHKKLQVWSDWSRGRESGALGYKASSINLWHRVQGGEPDYVPDVLDASALAECDLIEAIVTGRLGRIPLLSRNVVRVYYLGTGTYEQKARDIGVSKSTFCGYLHNAQVQIGAVMDNLGVPVVARGVGVRIKVANIPAACNEKMC